MSELKLGIMKRLWLRPSPGPDRCALAGGAIAKNAGPQSNRNASAWQCQIPREHRLGPRPGCRRVAFAKVGVVYTAADIEELSARLIATTGPAAAHQLHELDTALAQLREQ